MGQSLPYFANKPESDYSSDEEKMSVEVPKSVKNCVTKAVTSGSIKKSFLRMQDSIHQEECRQERLRSFLIKEQPETSVHLWQCNPIKPLYVKQKQRNAAPKNVVLRKKEYAVIDEDTVKMLEERRELAREDSVQRKQKLKPKMTEKEKWELQKGI